MDPLNEISIAPTKTTVLLIVIVYSKHYFRTMCTFEIGVWETEYLLPYCEIQWPISGKQD